MTKSRKAIIWLAAIILIAGAATIISFTSYMGGCPATETAIRESLEETLNTINSRTDLIELNRMSPLDQGAKAIAVHMDNKMFGYDIEAELSNGSSIYLKLDADWRFCIPSERIPAYSFINEATSEPLKLLSETNNERRIDRSGDAAK